MKFLKSFIALLFPAIALAHPSPHHPPCCHANQQVSELLRNCSKDQIKIYELSSHQRLECKSKQEIVFLFPEKDNHESATAPATMEGEEEVCVCGQLSRKCHFSSSCGQGTAAVAALSGLQSMHYICVAKETASRLVQATNNSCDQIVNSNNEAVGETEKKAMLVIRRIKSSTIDRVSKSTKEIFNSTGGPSLHRKLLQALRGAATKHKNQGTKHKRTNTITDTPSTHQSSIFKAALPLRPTTTKKQHLHLNHKQPRGSATTTTNHQQISADDNFQPSKQHTLRTKAEFKRVYDWVSKHIKPEASGKIADVGALKKWIKVFFDSNYKTSNKRDSKMRDDESLVAADKSEVDSLAENLMESSRYSQKRQAYGDDTYQSSSYNEHDETRDEVTEGSNKSGVHDTFVNRQVLLWFSSLAEPRWIKSHINENAEKFSLYVILFVFLGVISTMGAVIYRLFFQVKVHKKYIIGKKTAEKEDPNDNEDGNVNEAEEKDKEPLKKEQPEGEEKFNSPGNWRTPESESSTGDDRTLRDDEHANLSNIERTDSRHVMCTIVSQERSLDEISQVEQRQHDANNNNQPPDDQALSGQMGSSMLQQTSSPPLSAITNRSSSPPHSPNIHHHSQQPTLPSPPGSFMFEPPPPNDLNPIIIDQSIVTVHPPKLNDHESDNPDINTLARRSRELY